MIPENLLAEWSRVLLESFADSGVKDVIVSPGSRSTPLVVAALSSRRIRCTSVIDERDAGFFALGQAKMTGKPVAVVCTSGSAAANYFPAVVEARLSHTPLLVLTADRPFELQDSGAPQTIDQTRLYGEYARFVDLGMPEPGDGPLRALRRRAAQAVFESLFPVPGTVHVNVRARKPLEPVPATSREAQDLTRRVDVLLASPVVARAIPGVQAKEAALASLARDLETAERGIVVCGPALPSRASPGAALARLATALGFPVYAEATSQLRFDAPELPPHLIADGLDVLMRAEWFGSEGSPDVVLQIGEAPISGAWERLLAARPPRGLHVLTEHGWPDPESRAHTIVTGELESSLDRLTALVRGQAPRPSQHAWAARLSEASRVAGRVVAELCTTSAPLTESVAAHTVIAALPSGSTLALGNSLPVRHADTFAPARPGAAIRVWSQRGASGIDGVIAGAAGAAVAGAREAVLLVGDVTALHDVGGFAVAARSTVPLVIVVIHNDGGRIFEQLPLAGAGLGGAELELWTTPHGRSFEHVARFFDLRYERPRLPGELSRAVERGLAGSGCTLVEVVCEPEGIGREYGALVSRISDALRDVRKPSA